MGAYGGLEEWAACSGRRRAGGRSRGYLRFAFYGRVSTEDWQDPASSLARQQEQAGALVRGHGMIVAKFFDVGQSRSVAWARRPQAAALVVQLADPDRGWDAIVVGEYERAFYGGQYALMAPLFEHYGVQLWLPEAGGRIDFSTEHDERTMTVLGLSSTREIVRTSSTCPPYTWFSPRPNPRLRVGGAPAATLTSGLPSVRRTRPGSSARTKSSSFTIRQPGPCVPIPAAP